MLGLLAPYANRWWVYFGIIAPDKIVEGLSLNVMPDSTLPGATGGKMTWCEAVADLAKIKEKMAA